MIRADFQTRIIKSISSLTIAQSRFRELRHIAKPEHSQSPAAPTVAPAAAWFGTTSRESPHDFSATEIVQAHARIGGLLSGVIDSSEVVFRWLVQWGFFPGHKLVSQCGNARSICVFAGQTTALVCLSVGLPLIPLKNPPFL